MTAGWSPLLLAYLEQLPKSVRPSRWPSSSRLRPLFLAFLPAFSTFFSNLSRGLFYRFPVSFPSPFHSRWKQGARLPFCPTPIKLTGRKKRRHNVERKREGNLECPQCPLFVACILYAGSNKKYIITLSSRALQRLIRRKRARELLLLAVLANSSTLRTCAEAAWMRSGGLSLSLIMVKISRFLLHLYFKTAWTSEKERTRYMINHLIIWI